MSPATAGSAANRHLAAACAAFDAGGKHVVGMGDDEMSARRLAEELSVRLGESGRCRAFVRVAFEDDNWRVSAGTASAVVR